RRMMREHLQRLHTFLLAILLEFLAQHDLCTGLVHALFKLEFTALLRLLDGPSGEHLCELGHILLRVSAIYAEGVQLHDLARVVFVQPAATLVFLRIRIWAWRLRRPIHDSAKRTTHKAPALLEASGTAPILGEVRIRSDTLPIVEIEKHRRALRSCDEKVFELTQRARANHIAFVR